MGQTVVITAFSMITPIGNSARQITQAMTAGDPVPAPAPFDPEVATFPVASFHIKDYTGRFKETRYLNRGAAFAVATAVDAFQQSGLTDKQIQNAGLFTGAGPNFDLGSEINEIQNGELSAKGLQALWILKFLPNTATSVIAKYLNIHGENATTGSACAASLMAIGEAYRKIKDGYLDIAFAGGGDSRLNPGGILAYKMAGALCSNAMSTETPYHPFSGHTDGFVPGEGGAFFVLESLDHAMARNASIVAEIKGYGTTIDGYNMTAPDPSGTYAKMAVEAALAEAGIPKDHIDIVSAHGTGTPLNDQMESQLIQTVFTPPTPKVVTLKSHIGHLASACGAAELSLMLSCMQQNFIPATLAPDSITPDPPEQQSFGSVLIENFGFGGQNAALVVTKWQK